MEFPAMLYRPGTMLEWDGEMFDYIIVGDEDEAGAALADGWVPHKPTGEEPAPEPEAVEPEKPKPVRKPRTRRKDA